MKIGVMIFATDQAMPITEVAREAEARGFESLFLPEKTHVPVSRATPWPGGDLPEFYKRTLDPLVALAAAAAVTTRIRLGTGILLAAARDPIILAKEVASLDLLSGGRFVLGIGYGWNEEELADHGTPFHDRALVMRDKIRAMEAIWRDDEASYEGPYVRFGRSWSWPKPLQRPRPPIVMGSRASSAIFADIAEYCDGWMPIEQYGVNVERITDLREAFAAAGRAVVPEVSIFASMGDAALLDRYALGGADRVVLALPPAGSDAVIPALDRFAPLVDQYSD